MAEKNFWAALNAEEEKKRRKANAAVDAGSAVVNIAFILTFLAPADAAAPEEAAAAGVFAFQCRVV